MKEVIFCFIEPDCWNWGVNDIAEQNGFLPLYAGDFFRNFLANEGFGDNKAFLEAKHYLDNGIVFPINLILNICIASIQPHLQENLLFVNFTKYKELMQVLEKEGYKLKHICYIYHETLDILFDNYRQKSQFYAEMAKDIENRVFKKRSDWKEIISDTGIVRIGYNLGKIEEFKENVKRLFI